MAIASAGGETSKYSDNNPSARAARTEHNSLQAALFILDKNGAIEDLNSIALDLCGASNSDCLHNRPFRDFFTEIERSKPNQASIQKNVFSEGTLHTLHDKEIPVQVLYSPALENSDKTLVLMNELPEPDKEAEVLLQAYKRQKALNQKLGEILELGRTFSLHTDLNSVMNQIVRVVGESTGYGFVGLYLKDPETQLMRVATHTDTFLDFTTFKKSNPGNDWDILTLVNNNPSDLVKIGGKRLPVTFGMDGEDAGEGRSKGARRHKSAEIWEVDGALLAMVQLKGAVTCGYLRVSDPIENHCQKQMDVPVEDSETFCQQALWIYANQAAVAIENAIQFERVRLDINERTRLEQNLTLTQNELEQRILRRTQELEKLNAELRSEIMEREVAQQELDQQSTFLRQVLDTNPILIYARDRNGKYTLINEAAARFEGLTIDEVIGKTDNELNHDLGQIIRWRHEDLDVMDNAREIILPEERVLDTHGNLHIMQTIKRPIIGRQGKIDQVLGVSVEITARKKAEERVVQASAELARAYDATIEGWSRALDLRDRETEGHSLRVTNMTLRLAGFMGIDQSENLNLRRGALLHDIGKMGIPDEILFKKGTLNNAEWVVMRKHPTYAYEMLNPIDYLHPALVIPKYHHEKWDGTGYPENLEGEMIPLAARIFSIVDVWDALTSDRPYRSAWSQEDVLEYIKGNSGTHFDPHVVDTFVTYLDEIVQKSS